MMVQENVFNSQSGQSGSHASSVSHSENRHPITGEIEMSAQVTPWQQSSARQCHPARRAFTLVELLVVITIIGILVALLIPAVNIAVRSAKNAQIGVEMNLLVTALEQYKNDHLEYPPDFGGAYDKNANLRLRAINETVRTHLTPSFRYRTLKGNTTDLLMDINSPVQLSSSLDPAEALVFWLSGFTGSKEFPLTGTDPTNHDNRGKGGRRVKGKSPYFDFDQTRLIDKDGDGYPEYYPKNVDQPYVYIRPSNYEVVHSIGYNAGSALGQAVAYGSTTGSYAEPEKFQIICAGLDNDFGSPTSRGGSPVYPDGVAYLEADEDNITSFSGGKTLEAAIP